MASNGSFRGDHFATAKSLEPAPTEFTYSEKDAILYALGVGVSTRQEDTTRFLYESREDFCVIPTYGVIPCFEQVFGYAKSVAAALNVSMTKLLHGEHYLEVHKPLPRAGTLTSHLSVADVLDKGSGMSVIVNVVTNNDQGEKVTTNQYVFFFVGCGNFGGKKSSDQLMPVATTDSQEPDFVMEEVTSVDQAALYRLSGDLHPLHIDPEYASKAGFEIPILHGLCTFGYSVRQIMKKCANNDMDLFKAVKVRFSKPVTPGETLKTEMWKEGNRIYFKTKVVETGNYVITGAYMDLY